jgi:hypothetical protein
MGTIHRFTAARSLGPAELDVAAAVYVEVVDHLDLPADDDVTRELVAQFIVDQMLSGELDPGSLREGAVARLQRSPNL